MSQQAKNIRNPLSLGQRLLFMVLLALFFSCTVEPAKIEYGTDACHFCKMTIVDKQHAAQMVTAKGRSYKYDAIECMLNDLSNWPKDATELLLINDYASPGLLMDATISHFLISQSIPSPMGANLSGFRNYQTALETQNNSGGELYTWSELRQQYD